MTTELVTGYAGAPHVSSDDAGRCWAGIVGSDCYILPTMSQLECTVQSANSVAVAPGDAMMMGRHVTVTSTETLTIDSGSMGMQRHDIVGIRYTKDGGTLIETAALEVIKGTPGNPATDPTLPSGDILNGATDAFMPLWRIPLDELTIQDPEPMAVTVVTLEDATADYDELSRITMGSNYAALNVGTSAYWTHDNGLMRMLFTNTGNIRVDTRANVNDAWSTLGYALVTNNTAFNASANTVLAAPNGSSGAVTLRKLVANDIPNIPASKITSGQLNAARMPQNPTFTTVTLGDGAVIEDTGTGNIHMTTPDDGQTSQAQYSIENDGSIYSRTRTRASASDPWGSWSAWSKIAG